MKAFKFNRVVAIYLAKFIGLYCILFYSTVAMYGLITPKNYYSPFLAEHFRLFDWFGNFLLFLVKYTITLFGYTSHLIQTCKLKIDGGSSIFVAPPCMGFAVLSFWIAFVISNRGTIKKKINWVLIGCIGITLINVFRITLVLITFNDKVPMPFNIDHHTFFSVLAYTLVFLLMYLYHFKTEKEIAEQDIEAIA